MSHRRSCTQLRLIFFMGMQSVGTSKNVPQKTLCVRTNIFCGCVEVVSKRYKLALETFLVLEQR